MKKHITILLGVLTLFTLTACNNEADEENNTVEQETTENINSSNDNNVNAENSHSIEQEEQAQFISEAFHTLLDYDNTTYDERTQKATEYFTKDTLLALTNTEHVDTAITFTSTSENYELYQGVGNQSNYFILVLDTSFQVEENPSTDLTNIYEFELVEHQGQYRIDKLQATPKQQKTMIP